MSYLNIHIPAKRNVKFIPNCCIVILLVLLPAFGIAEQAYPNPMSNGLPVPTLRFQLRVNDIYIVGQPVIIKFTLENLSREAIWVLTWNTPFEGLKGDFLWVTCDGKEIPYKGRLVKRGDPTPEEYILIKSGESATVEVNLSSVYTFTFGKKCRITFKGWIHDTVRGENPPSRRRDEHRGMEIFGNTAVIRVVKP